MYKPNTSTIVYIKGSIKGKLSDYYGALDRVYDGGEEKSIKEIDKLLMDLQMELVRQRTNVQQYVTPEEESG